MILILKEWHTDAINLKKQGLSSRAIAKMLGKGKSSVNDLLKKVVFIEKPLEKKKGPRVLFFDIETRQLTLEGFGLFNQNFSLEQIAEDWSLLSFSAKWGDSEDIMYYDVSEMTEDDLLEKLYELFDEADFLVAHNGRRFDVKRVRARMIARGFKPHSPVRIIDTLEICKKEFAMTSNKLQYLTNLLCKTNKKSSHAKFPGFMLWREFVRGNPEAIQEMRDYNIVDVTSLQELYEIIAPWSSTLPVFEVYEDDISDMENWEDCGFVYSNLGKYTKYRNKVTGQYRRGIKNLLSKEKKESLLRNIV
tara:strand:- start:53482 stop:54396 length:915 start_codon:yes stop_codon:yes gene_type:complete